MRRCPSLPLTIKVTHVTLLTALFYGGESLNRNEVSMHTILLLSSNSRSTAGVLLLTIVAIEYGGWFMLRVVRGRQPATPFQQAFFRGGHSHAGLLVILARGGQNRAQRAPVSGLL